MVSYASGPILFAFFESVWETKISTLLSSPTVSPRFVRHPVYAFVDKMSFLNHNHQNFAITIGRPKAELVARKFSLTVSREGA